MEFVKKCLHCGKEFTTKGNRGMYCCEKCKKDHYSEQKRWSRWKRILVCEECGRMFNSKGAKKYCCAECRVLATNTKTRKNVFTKEPSVNIETVTRLAREEGLSYGQYVAKHNLK